METVALLKPLADTLLDHLDKEAEFAQRIAESKLRTALLQKEDADRKRDLVKEGRRNAESLLAMLGTTSLTSDTSSSQPMPSGPLPTPPNIEPDKLMRREKLSLM